MEKLPVGIYGDGNEVSCRVYFGEIPGFMTSRFKLIYSGEVDGGPTPLERGYSLIDANSLEVDRYVDGSIPARFGVQLKLEARTLAGIVEKTFGISMNKKSL